MLLQLLLSNANMHPRKKWHRVVLYLERNDCSVSVNSMSYYHIFVQPQLKALLLKHKHLPYKSRVSALNTYQPGGIADPIHKLPKVYMQKMKKNRVNINNMNSKIGSIFLS